MAKKIDINEALLKAASEGSTTEVKKLLAKGADINAKNDWGQTALMIVIDRGHTETSELLIDKRADINAKNDEGWTALIWAAFRNKTETVELLIDKGADIEAKDNKGRTALLLAAPETLELLIDKGADINAKDDYGNTKLIDEVTCDANRKTLELLIDKGADIEAKGNRYGQTALMTASEGGYIKNVELLIDKGANINAKDNEGRTALFWAVGHRQKETATLLIAKGADVENKYGRTALQWAIKEGDPATVELLTKKSQHQRGKLRKKTVISPKKIKMVDVNGNDNINYSIDYDNNSLADFVIVHPEVGFDENKWRAFAEQLAACYHPHPTDIDYVSARIPENIKAIKEIAFSPYSDSDKMRIISLEKYKNKFADIIEWYTDDGLVFYCESEGKETLKVTEIYNFFLEETHAIYKNIKKLDVRGYFMTVFRALFNEP